MTTNLTEEEKAEFILTCDFCGDSILTSDAYDKVGDLYYHAGCLRVIQIDKEREINPDYYVKGYLEVNTPVQPNRLKELIGIAINYPPGRFEDNSNEIAIAFYNSEDSEQFWIDYLTGKLNV